jgi:ribosomal protein S18 acetylase RimI-like enzyme
LEVKARLAAVNDAEQLSELNRQFNGGDRRPVDEVAASIAAGDEVIAVAEIDGQVVGFGCAQSFRSFCYRELLGEITELYVAESHRRKGVASAILACLEEQLKHRGVTEVKVLTGSDNATAIRTYEHCGYVRDDELLLKKELSQDT